MSLFGAITITEFLQQYWQQQSLLVRDVFTELEGVIDGNDLAGLACDDAVESRLILGRALSDAWVCRQGPFNEADFTQLPEKDWTLLVQGVDQWDTEINALLDRFDFLPRWRLEDIMVSYAPCGGGVGPHFDYYDVFLIQASGSRQWQLGDMCNEQTPLQDHPTVKLLAEFSAEVTHELHAGDMLYIPAGMAHWGVASSDDCITCSVGFRAPSERELIERMLAQLVDELAENKRYRDPKQLSMSGAASIDAAAQQQVFQLLDVLTPEKLREAATTAFGELVTQPRHLVMIDDDDMSDISADMLYNEAKQSGVGITLAPHSRLAFQCINGQSWCHFNGDSYPLAQAFIDAIDAGYIAGALLEDPTHLNLLTQWIEQGDIRLIG